MIPILGQLPDKQWCKQELGELENYINENLKKFRKHFASAEDLEDQIKETVWDIEKKYTTRETFEEFQKDASLKLMRHQESINDFERRVGLLQN